MIGKNHNTKCKIIVGQQNPRPATAGTNPQQKTYETSTDKNILRSSMQNKQKINNNTMFLTEMMSYKTNALITWTSYSTETL